MVCHTQSELFSQQVDQTLLSNVEYKRMRWAGIKPSGFGTDMGQQKYRTFFLLTIVGQFLSSACFFSPYIVHLFLSTGIFFLSAAGCC